jgi:PAS domain S-box-containing protein
MPKPKVKPEAVLLQSGALYMETLKVLRIAAALLPLLVVPLGLLSKYSITDSQFYAGDGWMIFIGLSLLIAAPLQFYILGRWPTRLNYLIMSTTYHVLSVLFVLFVCGVVQTPLIIFWVVLTMGVDAYFGTRAFWISTLVLNITIAVALLMHPELSPQEQVLAFLNGVIISITSFIASRLQIINDRIRLVLLRTRQRENLQRERLLALVNSMGDAVVTTDSNGGIKVYNAALLGLLDTNGSLAGKNIDNILELKTPQKQKFSIVREAERQRVMFSRVDLVHIFEDGEELKLYINVAPIHPDFRVRSEQGFIFIIRDITKEKTLEEERDEFISVISHELRTPVAIVEGNLANIKLLQQHGSAQSVIDHAVEDAHTQVLYLAKLVNDLGALARAERGVGSDLEDINLEELLDTMYKEYLPQAKELGLKLHLELSQQLPNITASRLYLTEIMQNLITNALKYTKQGSVTISCHKSEDNEVHMAVKDTGIGIGKSDQKHVFEKFYRSEDYRTRESKGTGLGLYVSQKLAAKMGVKLAFESRLNHGSTFTLTLKASAKHPRPEAVAASEKPA